MERKKEKRKENDVNWRLKVNEKKGAVRVYVYVRVKCACSSSVPRTKEGKE